MKGNSWFLAAALCLVVGAAGIVQAQYSATSAGQEAQTTQDTHRSTRTITGCLQKTGEANEYNLVAEDGSSWELKSDSVDLGRHVGHTVAVTGAVAHPTAHGMKEDAKEEAKEHGIGKSSTEHGHMTVTDLSMVSESCR